MDCTCHSCIKEKDIRVDGLPLGMVQMILCPVCGNKRCPKASDHNLACTNSNEVGQEGSIYAKPPKQGTLLSEANDDWVEMMTGVGKEVINLSQPSIDETFSLDGFSQEELEALKQPYTDPTHSIHDPTHPNYVASDKGPWHVREKGKYIESDDFTHDVRLYINGDFYDEDQRLDYATFIADKLND